jgi:phosphoribosylanthranilate isomerase
MFVKICGITSVADARIVAAAGANAIGLNFYPASPRFVALDAARDIVQTLPPFLDHVGVFVNATPVEVRATAGQLGLRTVQLHGDIPPEWIVELGEFSVMCAFSLSEQAGDAPVLDYLDACAGRGRLPSALLIDAQVPGLHGGTGRLAPWSIAGSIVARSPVPVALAGGLTSKNVAEAIRAVRPWGVDVASGVEVAPGRKESYKVRKFVEAARGAV